MRLSFSEGELTSFAIEGSAFQFHRSCTSICVYRFDDLDSTHLRDRSAIDPTIEVLRSKNLVEHHVPPREPCQNRYASSAVSIHVAKSSMRVQSTVALICILG